MNIELNLDLQLKVEDGALVVRLVQSSGYPNFENEVVAEASVSLRDLENRE